MANTIGKASLILGANNSGLEKGLEGASKGIQGFAVSVGGGINFITSSFAGLAGAVLFKGFTLSLSEIASQISEQFDAIDNAAKAAQRTGTDIDRLLGLEHAGELAGANGEMIEGALDRLNKAAANGSPAFEKLGISQEQLLGTDAVGKFQLVADGLAGIDDAATRTSIAMQLFGRSGAMLLPTLTQGGQALRDQAADYERIAGRIGTFGAVSVEAANDAATRAGKAWEGLIKWAAVQLAPVKEVVSVLATELLAAFRAVLPESTNLGDLTIDAFEMVADGAVQAADAILAFGEPMINVFSTLLGFIGPIVQGIGDIAAGLTGAAASSGSWLGNMQEGLASAISNVGEFVGLLPEGTTATMATVQMQQPQNNLFDAAAVQARIAQFSQGMRDTFQNRRMEGFEGQVAQLVEVGFTAEEATAQLTALNAAQAALTARNREEEASALKVGEAMGKLAESIAQVGMSEQERQLAQLAMEGATPDQIVEAAAMQEQLRFLEEAAKLTQQFADPAATLTDRLADLDAMFASGAISAEVFAQAQNEAITAAERAAGMGEVKLASQAIEGSREAVAAVMRHQIQGGVGNDPQTRILRVQEQQREIQRQMLEEMRIQRGVPAVAQDGPQFAGVA